MSVLEILVTYLAVGSAFAMRAYFINRRRPLRTIAQAVVGQFVFWLPIWLAGFLTRVSADRRYHLNDKRHQPEVNALVEKLLDSLPSIYTRNQAREVIERYAALDAAINIDEGGPASGQFELFAVSGNGNGATGTPCLYRKNASKLRIHKRRTADDLVRLVLENGRRSPLRSGTSDLAAFFEAYGDTASIEKLSDKKVKMESYEHTPVRIAA